MKFRFLGVSAIAVVLGFSMAGCAKNSIVGKWSGNIGESGNATIEYKADGTETMTINQRGIPIVINGNYTIKDDTITANLSSISISGHTGPLPPQIVQTQTAQFKLDGDNLTLTHGSAQPYTLTRVKS